MTPHPVRPVFVESTRRRARDETCRAAAAFMLAAALLFAVMSVMVKLLSARAANAVVVFVRSALSLLVLLPPILHRGSTS